MIPCGDTRRTSLAPWSTMHTSPRASVATATGALSSARRAGPSSPHRLTCRHGARSPANRVRRPAGDTFHTTELRASAMYTSPCPSAATPVGSRSCARIAGPPAPHHCVRHGVPSPANRAIRPDAAPPATPPVPSTTRAGKAIPSRRRQASVTGRFTALPTLTVARVGTFPHRARPRPRPFDVWKAAAAAHRSNSGLGEAVAAASAGVAVASRGRSRTGLFAPAPEVSRCAET